MVKHIHLLNHFLQTVVVVLIVIRTRMEMISVSLLAHSINASLGTFKWNVLMWYIYMMEY